MNIAQKEILVASKAIDESTDGRIRISYYQDGARWNLRVDGDLVVTGWTINEMRAFIRGWELRSQPIER